MEKKAYPEISLEEKIDILSERADNLAAEISALSLNDEERELFKEIQEFRDKIGTNKKGEVVDVYNGEELKQVEKAKNDLWDLKVIVLERLKKESVPNIKVVTEEGAPAAKTAVTAEALGFKKTQERPPLKRFEVSDYKINIPEELKDDPEIKNIIASIQRDIQSTLKNKTRVSSEMLESFGRNAETRKWYSFVKNNPGKARAITEKYGDQFPQVQRVLSKIDKGVFIKEAIKPESALEETSESVLVAEAEEKGVADRGEGNDSKNNLEIGVEGGKDRGPRPKDEFAGFSDEARAILTEDEIKTIKSAAPKEGLDRRKDKREFERESWRQAARIVDKLTDERINEAKDNSQQEQQPLVAQKENTIEELEQKRRSEAEAVGIPTVEFYNEADKEKALKEKAAKLGIPTIEEKEKEPILSAEGVKPLSADKKILDGFAELGVSQNDLEKIEGFKDLTAGQQYLILESFEQLTLGKIKEDALEQYKEEVKRAGLWGKVKKGITKKYQIAKIEKSVAEDFAKAGVVSQESMLSRLVKSVKEQGIDAVISKEGELEFKYISGLESLNPEEQGKIDKFNKAAAELSKIPYEWSLETAGARQKVEYIKAKNKYDNAFIYASEILMAKKGLEKGQEIFLDIQNKIKFNQFISTHPEVEEQLKNIKTNPALRRIWKDIAAERGAYFGVGWGVRGISASLLAVGGAGVGVMVSGAGFAAWRANSALKEQDVLARRDISFPKASEEQQKILKEKSKELAEKEQWLKARFPEYVKAESDYLEEIVKLNKKEKADEAPSVQEVEILESLKDKYEKERLKFETDPLVQDYFSKKSQYKNFREKIFPSEKTVEEERKKNVVAAKPLAQKIEDLANKVQSETDKDKKQKLSESLRARLIYTDGKLKNGLVNFGSYENRFLNNCNLMNGIQRATAALAIFGDPKIESELEKRLEKFLDLKKQKISKARRKYLVKEAGKGALYGALFFGLGYGARWLWNEYGHHIKEGISEILPRKPFITETEYYFESSAKLSAAVGKPGGGVEAVMSSGPQASKKAVELLKEIQVQPIKERGPEGAIIDYFKANPDAAKKIGYQKEMNFNKWVGTKAHQLWLKHEQDAIKNPDIQETLKKLGYAPDDYIKGYEEMMKHISNGGVKIDISKGNVDLIDMEYLKFKAGGLEDMPSGIQIDEGFPPAPQIDEGTATIENRAVEAIDNVISVSALPSVERFAFTDIDFSVGEFNAIKNISVEKLLNEIPSDNEAWKIWRGEVEGKSINLPHHETYWYTQFKRQINLAERIRQIVKEQKIKPDILKNISIGKFIEKYIVSASKR